MDNPYQGIIVMMIQINVKDLQLDMSVKLMINNSKINHYHQHQDSNNNNKIGHILKLNLDQYHILLILMLQRLLRIKVYLHQHWNHSTSDHIQPILTACNQHIQVNNNINMIQDMLLLIRLLLILTILLVVIQTRG